MKDPKKLEKYPEKSSKNPKIKCCQNPDSLAQKLRHAQKSDEDPFEISKNPPRICDQKIFSTPKIRVSKKNDPGWKKLEKT